MIGSPAGVPVVGPRVTAGLLPASRLNVAVSEKLVGWGTPLQLPLSPQSPPSGLCQMKSVARAANGPRLSQASSAASTLIGRWLLIRSFLEIVLKNKLTGSKVVLCRRCNRENHS